VILPLTASEENPIGVFDSGVGGLAVLFELERILPRERYVYFADTLRCPWGSRPSAEIVELSRIATDTLLERGAKIIVVACNSATTTAIHALRAEYDVPFVGTVPAVKPAASLSSAGRIGVMATRATIASGALRSLRETFAASLQVFLYPCADRLVELVEAGITDGDEVRAALEPVMSAAGADGVDVLVLGCTHYTFLKGAISAMAPEVTVLDAGLAIARQVARVLDQRHLARCHLPAVRVEYLASADLRGLEMRSDMLRRSYLAHAENPMPKISTSRPVINEY
jgi:glutamate racemase